MKTHHFLFFMLLAFISAKLLAYGAASPPANQDQNKAPVYDTPSTASIYAQMQARQELLPSDFQVYTDGKTAINHAAPGFTAVTLPTNNDFAQAPGCYVLCYSHSNTSGAIYPISDDTYAYGQVRVPGSYVGRICKPTGYENVDISGLDTFKALCENKIPSCKNNRCWAGGDTGGWFGIQ